MKKTFINATLFSLLLGTVPVATLTGCKDYDSDIDGLTQRDDELQKEINDKLAQQSAALTTQVEALQTALNTLKSDADTATKNAAAAAAAAQQTADKAEAAAQAANAEAQAAQAAAAAAQAAAVEEAINQVNALRDQINSQIADLKSEYGDKYTTLSEAVAKAATSDDLKTAVSKLEAAISASRLTQDEVESMLSAYLTQINTNTTAIAALSGRIDGVNSDLNTLKTDLGGKIAANEASIAKNAAAIAANSQNIGNNSNNIAANGQKISQNEAKISQNALAIQTETERINNIINTTIPGVKSDLEAADAQLNAALNAHISAYNTFETQVNAQLAALETFQNTYETLLSGLSNELSGIHGDITALQTRLTNAENSLTAAQADIRKNASDVSTINGLITALQDKDAAHDTAIAAIETNVGNAQADIVKINSALSTLNAIGAKRLTSVTLVPTSYVGGIPTIEFYSASYTPMGALGTDGIYAAPATGTAAKLITNNETKVFYRLNPAGVGINDIVGDDVDFVQMTAASRAADTKVVEVVGVTKDAETGFLVVNATKADGVTGSINNAEDGKIYTVALKVPVAPKNYYTWTDANGNEVTEDAADAVVYSEYSRLAERSFVPEIAQADSDPINHFSDVSIWTATDVAPVEEVSYVTEGFDLADLVTGCMYDAAAATDKQHTLMDADELASFGFTFEFSVPSRAYTVDGVNQQLYASVTKEGVLTSMFPTGSTVASCVDKTPIISVVMKRENDVVAQRFFKVKFIIDAEDATKTIDMFSETLSCQPIEATLSWAKFSEQVLSVEPFKMTKEEFLANYTVANVDGVTVDAANADAYISWNVQSWEIGDMKGKDATMERELVFTSTRFPDITVKLNGTVKYPELPKLGATDNAVWTNGVIEILPEAMPDPYVESDSITATYNTNIFSGRTAPYITGLLSCAEWDVKIDGVPTGFTIGGENNYDVNQGTETGATLWYENEHDSWLDATEASDSTTLKEMNFFINPNKAGIALVEAEATINLGWYININGTIEHDGDTIVNQVVLKNTAVKIIKPLQSLSTGEIEALLQDSKTQYRELAQNLQITDCFGHAFKAGSDYWKFYGITEIVWSNDTYLTDQDGNNKRTLASLNMKSMVDENGKLEFTGSGISLQQPIVLNVPVTVKHKWGELESVVKITITNPLNQQ